MENLLALIAAAGWLGTLLFIGVYHRTAFWWKTPYGRSLFSVSISLLIFFSSSLLFNVFGPEYPWRTPIRLISGILNTVMIWYLLIAIIRGGVEARVIRRQERERARDES